VAPVALVQADRQALPAASSARTPAQRKKLRVGLFADGRMQPRALLDAFSGAAIADHAEIVLIAIASRPKPATPWAWRAYRRVDRWFSGTPRGSATDVDLFSVLTAGDVMALPDSTAGIEQWRNAVVRLRLDVVFALGEIDARAFGWVANYGVWRFKFGAARDASEGLEGFTEVATGNAVTTTALSGLIPGRGEHTLCQSWSRTSPYSVSRNRERMLRRAASFPARILKALHHSGGITLSPEWPHGEAAGPAIGRPGAVRSLTGTGWRIARRALQKFCCVDQWFIAYRFGDTAAKGSPNLGQFKCLMPPKDRFWADPFPLEREGRHYIFFEEFVFAAGKAHLCVIEVHRDGSNSPPTPILERPYHLSYPFLVEENGQLYMVPESGQNGTVELYRCVRFPDRWLLQKTLLRAPYCVDATLHRADGRWWMFVNLGTDDADVHDELHLYHADSLNGDWQPHRANPVKSDVRSARPAGRLYESAGRLYRPAQIGTPLYGSGISINQVLALSVDEYREQEVARIVPPDIRGILGVHTINRAGELRVVDGFARRGRLGRSGLKVFEPRLLTTNSPAEIFSVPASVC
jgi:hypothetical protein